jgi:hypothetical protein
MLKPGRWVSVTVFGDGGQRGTESYMKQEPVHQGPRNHRRKYLRYGVSSAAFAAALALAGCGSAAPSAGTTAVPTASAAGGGADPACQTIASIWTTFLAQEQQQPGSGYGNLSDSLNAAIGDDTDPQLALAARNLAADAGGADNAYSGGYGQLSQDTAGGQYIVAFDTDAQAVSQDCGIPLPLPESAHTAG